MNSALNLHALGSCSFVLQLLVFVLHILKSVDLSSSLLSSSLLMNLKGFAGPLSPHWSSQKASVLLIGSGTVTSTSLACTEHRGENGPLRHCHCLTVPGHPLWKRTVFNVHS